MGEYKKLLFNIHLEVFTMSTIGEVAAEKGATGLRLLGALPEKNVRRYRELVEEISQNYEFVDEMMNGLTAHGKLEVIDEALKKYQK